MIFYDDVLLVNEAVAKYGHPGPAFVEAGGLEDPTIADYQRSVDAMVAVRGRTYSDGQAHAEDLLAAQKCRYREIHRPLNNALPNYVCEDPGNGGVSIEGLSGKYGKTLGVLVCLSTLEHVEEVWDAPGQMWAACRPGALVIVSVPFEFPWHGSPPSFGDHFRFSPTGLDSLFRIPKSSEGLGRFDRLDSGFRLDIDAGQGVLCTRTGKPQAIKSAYWIGRVK